MIIVTRLVWNPVTNKMQQDDSRQVSATSVEDLFVNTDHYLSQFPENERVNLYFTVADCYESPRQARKLRRQDFLMFDVDGCEESQAQQVIGAVCDTLNVGSTEVLSTWTGHGVHVLVRLSEPIVSDDYFKNQRDGYKAICEEIQNTLSTRALIGKIDSQVFTPARLSRVPKTLNDKSHKGLPVTPCYSINTSCRQFALLDLNKISGIELQGHMPPNYFTKFPTPDEKTILTECAFVRHCIDDAATLSEPDWFAMASIYSKLPSGEKLFHEHSSKHPHYRLEEAQDKFDRMTKAGPIRCETVALQFKGCRDCQYFAAQIPTPLHIKGDDFIATEKTGFHFINDKGQKTPDYRGLALFYKKDSPIFSIVETGQVYTFDKTHWVPEEDSAIRKFAADHFDPRCNMRMSAEFLFEVKNLEHKRMSWFLDSTTGKINFKNGVYDIHTKKLRKHSPNYGFTSVLDYDYVENAKAPLFEKFLEQVSCGDSDISKLLMEYVGYSLAGEKPKHELALLLYGEGLNGKSVFCEVVSSLFGTLEVANISFSDFQKEYHLVKLKEAKLNMSTETPEKALLESDLFKKVISGEEICVADKYEKAVKFRPYAKFIFSSNKFPKIIDSSKGLHRRLKIIPFNLELEESERDFKLSERLRAERSGIFNLAMTAYERLCTTDRFTECKSSQNLAEEFKLYTDPMLNFMNDCLDISTSDTDFVAFGELFDVYAGYVKRSNYQGMGKNKFSHEIQKRLMRRQGVEYGRYGKKQLTGFKGVKLVVDDFSNPVRNKDDKTH